ADGGLNFSQQGTGSYLNGLPETIQFISSFGERPVFSPDSKKIAFIGKSYGDAYEYDLETKRVRNLTAHAPNAGFLRVHYLPNGDYLLLGPRRIDKDRMAMRIGKIELWYLAKDSGSRAYPLNEIIAEGIAVSRLENRIGWATLEPKRSTPEDQIIEQTTLNTGLITFVDGIPKLTEKREIIKKPTRECVLEAQDFRDADRELMAACYDLGGVRLSLGKFTPILHSVILGVRIETREIITYRDVRDGSFTETEGISSTGDWTLVECGPGDEQGLDLCRLDLDKPGRPLIRLTHTVDYGKHRMSNPVMSPDGNWIAFQVGRAADEAGVGMGILMMPAQGEAAP
ncbi:MAG: hypothetical protein VW684_10215, partial [Betaproteobacteria bacterium]